MEKENKLFSKDFFFASFATFIFFSSFYLLIPILPLYILKIGGNKSEIGLIIGVFTISSLLLRPIVGQLSDVYGRKKMMMIGMFIYVTSSLLYNFAYSILMLLIIRLYHGSGMGSYSTSAGTYIADITPIKRRAEAMSYYGIAINLAMAIGPALSMMLLYIIGFNNIFYISSFIAFIGVLLVLNLKEHYKPEIHIKKNLLTFQGMFTNEVIFPSLINFGVYFTYGSVISYIPVFAKEQNITNPGIFFTVYALAMLLSRLLSGKAVDKFSRNTIIIPSIALNAIGLILLSFTSNVYFLILTSVVYGIGMSFSEPMLNALLIDRIDINQRGKAMGTFTGFMELGIGSGAMIMGLLLHFTTFNVMYLITASISFINLIFFIIGIKRKW